MFGYRRQLKEAAARHPEAEELQFVPAVVDTGASAPVLRRRRKAPRCKSEPDVGMIEVEVDGVTIRAGRGADAQHDRSHRPGDTVERSIRPIALNRKNALFAGSDGGAEHWAAIASLIETCKLNDVDPLAYLTDVLTRIVNGHPNSEIDQLLPWAYRRQDLKAVA